MALCGLWILANIFLFNALQVYGSLPIPVLLFEDDIIEDDDTQITCMLPCNDCPDAELSIKSNVTLNDCKQKKGNYPNVSCTVEVTRAMHEMEFTCEAQFKTQSLPKKMNIQTDPEFTDCAYNLVWVEGQETSFLCKATGYPPPTVTCGKNNTKYMDGEKFTAMRNMSGQYTCTAKNKDLVRKSVNVTVEYKPKIVSVTVNPPLREEGDKVEISCEANGLPDPNYHWNTPSTDIQYSADKRVITIWSLKESHLGNYSCTIQNKHGTDHMEATLDFATKPKILSYLIEPSTQVLMGDNVTLICEASGFPAPVLTWGGLKPNMDVSRDKRSVTILGVKKAHVGSYTCTAQNKHGSDTRTQQLSLAVKPKIREIKVDPSDTVAEGTDVTLTCDAEGDPLPTYSWKTPDPQLKSSSNDLIISKTKKSHEGDYQCTAVNKFGQDTRTRKLSVKVKPKIREIKPNPSDSVAEGTDVTLTCDAEGDPLPNYSWKTPNPQLTSNSSILSISKAKKSHEGDYQCTVVNKFGQDTKTRKLSVKDPEPTQGNRGDRPQSLIATILATLIFLFFHLC